MQKINAVRSLIILKKEIAMKTIECVPQKISKLMLGSLMLAAAIGLIIIGITLLPVFGIVLAIPVIGMAIYVFRLHLNDQCEIDFPEK
jgi:hypothetical protein